MAAIVLQVRYPVKGRLLKNLRRCRAAGVRLRYLIVLNTLNGRSARQTAAVLQVHPTTVYRVLGRFRAYGEAGLADGRADNGADKRGRITWGASTASSGRRPPTTAGGGRPGPGNCWSRPWYG